VAKCINQGFDQRVVSRSTNDHRRTLDTPTSSLGPSISANFLLSESLLPHPTGNCLSLPPAHVLFLLFVLFFHHRLHHYRPSLSQPLYLCPLTTYLPHCLPFRVCNLWLPSSNKIWFTMSKNICSCENCKKHKVLHPTTGESVNGRILGNKELQLHRRLTRIEESNVDATNLATVNEPDEASVRVEAETHSRSPSKLPIPKNPNQKSNSAPSLKDAARLPSKGAALCIIWLPVP
jgi:hypothetical protein